ncbi:hypothetical protein CRG98_017741 [Punica granatum]|uniref:Uncharacterized protein n=1 Tax=Punica granatum TaxID=22663 RepID=A0A2I0K197_PUNGR|nr:hypothetical protein CRG98_017741 [Punica granatum]
MACGIARDVGDWSFEFTWASSTLKGRVVHTIVLKIAWNGYIYSTWRARNLKLHDADCVTEEAIWLWIRGAVRARMMGVKDIHRRVHTENQGQLMEQWQVPL